MQDADLARDILFKRHGSFKRRRLEVGDWRRIRSMIAGWLPGEIRGQSNDRAVMYEAS